MKKTALVWTWLCYLPVILIAASTAYGERLFPEIAAVTGLTAVFMTVGFAVRFFFYSAETKSKWLVYSAELLPAFFTVLIMWALKGGTHIIAALLFAASYFTGTQVYGRGNEKTVNTPLFIASLVMYIILGNSFVKLYDFDSVVFAVPLGIMIILWMFLGNEKNISRQVTFRHYDRRYLPQGMMRFNRIFTAVLSGIVLVLMIFYKQTAHAVSAGLSAVMRQVVKVISITEFDIEEMEMLSEEELQRLLEESEEAMSSYEPNLILQKSAEIFSTLFAAAVIVYIIKKGWLAAAARYMMASLRRAFSKGGKKDDSLRSLGYTDEYVDMTEEIPTVFSRMSNRRIWKNQYAEYKKMNSGTEKFREGYRLVMMWFRLADPSVKFSRTPSELASEFKISEVSALTERYYPVRYGGAECREDDMAASEKALAVIDKKTRVKKETAKKEKKNEKKK